MSDQSNNQQEFENKPGTMAIFEVKEPKENQPTHKGYFFVKGKKINVSLWVKTSKQGEKYLSGKIDNYVEF